MSLVQCSNVIKNFQMGKVQVEILRGVSLNIEKGEFAAIIGESGSGKSTLLNILGGLMPFDKGEVSIADTNLHNLNENQRALFRRKSIGFIFQSYNLLPQLTAFENVEMPLIFTGMSKVNRKKTVLDILERVGLKDRMNHKPSELSGGQQQRVSIGLSLIHI